jgi:hypothetical protein
MDLRTTKVLYQVHQSVKHQITKDLNLQTFSKIYDTSGFHNNSYTMYSLDSVTHVKAAATFTKGVSPSLLLK